jgi:polar amino acid transport system substrate-binding protein
MHVRKFIALLAAGALTLGLAACGSDADDEADTSNTTTPNSAAATTTTVPFTPIDCNGESAYDTTIGDVSDFTPVKADTLTVVTSLPGPGFWEGSDEDPADVTSGFEYEIAKKMQEAFGLANLEVRNESFDAIQAGTVTNFDVALSQITISCERAANVDFTIPYFLSNQGALTKADFDKPLSTADDAKNILWGVQSGTTALDLLNVIKPTQDIKQYQDLSAAYTALEAGQIESVLIDTAINLGQAARSNGALKVPAQFAQPSGPDQYGALVPTGSTNVPALNAVFKQLTDSGDLSKLANDNLTVDPALLPTITIDVG